MFFVREVARLLILFAGFEVGWPARETSSIAVCMNYALIRTIALPSYVHVESGCRNQIF